MGQSCSQDLKKEVYMNSKDIHKNVANNFIDNSLKLKAPHFYQQ